MGSDFITKIGEIAEVFDGPHATPKKIDTGPYFLSISSLENGQLDLSKSAHLSEEQFVKWTKRVTPREGDVLFSYETRLGEAALMPGGVKACLGRRMGLLRPNLNKVLPEYLLYAYLSPAFQSEIKKRTNHGATVERISLKELPDFEIRIPALSEQKSTVKVLKALNEKIALNNQVNQTLEQMAQTLFKSWFVDFDPVIDNALGAGNPIPEVFEIRVERRKAVRESADFKPLPVDVRQLFPSEFEESELGWIPKGWGVDSLSSVVDVIMGQSPKGTTYNDQNEGTPLVNGPVEFGIYHPVAQKWTTAPTKISKAKDLIVCVRGSTTGRYVVSDGEYCLGRGVCSIRSDDSPAFANYLFKSYLNKLLNLTTGSTFPSWSGPTLKNFKVVVPLKSILDRYEVMGSNLCSMMTQKASENESLTKLRDTLLPKLISGELRLDSPEVEQAKALLE